jgi:hypothetical protein
MNERTLEARVARLEATVEIADLKVKYAQICDDNYNADAVIELFTDDAVWDGGPDLGRHVGRAAIHRFFTETPITWALHYMVAPMITVNDDLMHASGTWYLWQPCSVPSGGHDEPVWIMATYDDRFVRESDGWKFSEIRVETQAFVPVSLAWRESRFWNADSSASDASL